MLQLRPTFSESWYRVAKLRAKLRSTAQISRQFYRGERWYVVRDPAGNQFSRLSDAAYRFIGLLDGKRTVEEAWDLAGGQLADDAPTQPEVIQLLSHLYAANLIESDVTPDAKVLLRRQKQMNQRKMKGRLMNLLFPRIPIWDLDSFLVRWLPVMRKVFSRWGAVGWLIVVISAIVAIIPHWEEMKLAAADTIKIHAHPENAFYLWAVFVLIKLIHELGHAFACRRFGGECHELGIMFLIFIPTPYVDASTAWAFPNRWQRIFVGAAGMIVEIFFAAICAFIWVATRGSSWPLIPQLAYNAMLIASVTTVLFNANPLLRYDGYYMLSDWLEIPNLRQKSSEYAMGLIKRHIFRLKSQQELPPPIQRMWLLGYAVTSGIYRTMVGFLIILMVYFEMPILGALMALGGVITWAIVPISKLTKYLMIDPELHRKRGRAVAFCTAVAALVVVLVGLVPFPVWARAEGYIEPKNKQVVYAKSNGFATDVRVHEGQAVKAGDVLIVCQDIELDTMISQLESQKKALKLQMVQASVMDQAQRKISEIELEAVQHELDEALQKKKDLTIVAGISGVIVTPHVEELVGRYVPRGSEILTIATKDTLVAKFIVDQNEYQLLAKHEGTDHSLPNEKVDVVAAGKLTFDKPMKVSSVKLLSAAQDEIPHAILGLQGGGTAAVSQNDPSGKRAAVQQFEVRVDLDNSNEEIFAGQRAYARFTLHNQNLLGQGVRKLMQLIQERASTASELVK